MKSTTFILLLLLLGTTTWIHGEVTASPAVCNNCNGGVITGVCDEACQAGTSTMYATATTTTTSLHAVLSPNSGPIVIGSKKEELPPPPKTACNPDESMWFYGLILCNYKDCCEHCRSKWASYERNGKFTGNCISVPELVRMLERSKRSQEELDNLDEGGWLYR